MKLKPLPADVRAMLQDLDAPPRLVAHLRLVHDVAATLVQQLDQRWPCLGYDRQAVLFGAATHDIGKALHPDELTGSGNDHAEAGFQLMTGLGIPEWQARFARTHVSWEADPNQGLEDLLVALADKIWKGRRDEQLEILIVQHIAGACQEERWSVYSWLDALLVDLAEGAAERLAWQNEHPL